LNSGVLSNLGDKQKNRQTDIGKNITLFFAGSNNLNVQSLDKYGNILRHNGCHLSATRNLETVPKRCAIITIVVRE